MIKCLVIDDEPEAVRLLTSYVDKSKDLQLVSSFTNPIEGFHFLNENEIDLIFLDIQMPELTGIQLYNLIRNKSQVIFTTAYEKYAVNSYALDVVDYLLKPIPFERFLSSVEKYKRRFVSQKSTTIDIDYFFVKSGYRTMKVNFSDCLYLEAFSDYVAIHTQTGKILTLETMRHFESALPQKHFIRVHRSFIVSIANIDFIEKNRICINDTYIPISKTYQADFHKKLNWLK